MERQIATCSLVSGQQTRRESARFYALPLAAIADQSNHERLALNHNNTACHVLLTDSLRQRGATQSSMKRFI